MSDLLLIAVTVPIALAFAWVTVAAGIRWIEGTWGWTWPLDMWRDIRG